MDIEDLGGDFPELGIEEEEKKEAYEDQETIRSKRARGGLNAPPPPRDPQLEILELKDDFIKFILSKTDYSMANALRRIMIAEVPTLAIDIVEIQRNDSVLFDEFFAHRLGLVPLDSTQAQNFNFKRDCECDDECEKCAIEFELDVINKTDFPMDVTSNDLIPLQDEQGVRACVHKLPAMNNSDRPEELPVLLVKIAKNQEVACRAIARKGIGKEHAKYIPVGVATFQYDPDVTINQTVVETLTEEQKRGLANSCPTKVFEYRKQQNSVVVSDARKCTYCEECTAFSEHIKKPELVTVKQTPERFIFSVETTGVLPPEEIVRQAIDILRKKLEMLQREQMAANSAPAAHSY